MAMAMAMARWIARTRQPGMMRDLGFSVPGGGSRRHSSSEAEVEAVAQMPETPPGASGTGGSVGRRFYKGAHTRPSDDGSNFIVMLDRWVLKTPAKKPVVVPTAGLALAIAAEWEWQTAGGIRPFTMPLMKLAATAIDRVPLTRGKIIENLMKYSHTDSIYCRAPESSPLHGKQAEVWDPLVQWIEAKIGAKPSISSNILMGSQPKEVLQAIERILNEYNDWELAAVDFLAASGRSLVVALAIMDEHLDVEEALKVIRVDEDFQVEEWGFVEGGHDIDVADLRVRITAASIFHRLLSHE